MNEPSFDVIAAGHLCLDMFPSFSASNTQTKIADLLRPGTLIHMGPMAFGTGGAVSNTGIAMKKFGCRVGFVAKVGDDVVGRIIVDLLKANGSADGIKISKGEGSSYSVVLAPPRIDRIFLHCPGTNDTFTAADIDYDLVRRAKLFHFGYPTLMRNMFLNDGEDQARIMAAAKATGATTSLDISLPDPNSEAGKANWRAILTRTLPHVDLFVPSIEEAFFCLYPEEYRRRKQEHGGDQLIDHISDIEYSRIADEFIAMGCKVAVLKAGHDGWYIKTAKAAAIRQMGRCTPTDPENWAERELWCPAFYIEQIASATGAGDASIASFLTSVLHGASIEKSLKMANCAGYCNLTSLDSLTGLTSYAEMETLAPTLPTEATPVLAGKDWTWSDALRLWEKKQ